MSNQFNEIYSSDNSSNPRRYIARINIDKPSAAIKALSNQAGLNVASASDFEGGAIDPGVLNDTNTIFLEKLGIAIIQIPSDQVGALEVGEGSPISSIRPEREFFILGSELDPAKNTFEQTDNFLGTGETLSVSADYLRGYQTATNRLISEISGSSWGNGKTAGTFAQIDQTKITWGLQVTGINTSSYTGKGVKVAVLDTGIDLDHPDFFGRKLTSQSFIQGVPTAQDGHGHGTHCAGTVCGPVKPSLLPRYGAAPDIELYVGKVLRDNGSGPETAILMGINWALENGCRIISMSLGRQVVVGEPPDDDYEDVGRKALDNNCLIIAAAGNESARPGLINPVGSPANSTTIMAVAALQNLGSSQLGIAGFSNGGINQSGGKIDIGAPGVSVLSAWSSTALLPQPGTLYRSINGTSMATPHVAGIAALWIEKDPASSADKIMQQLTQTAKSLPLPARDVGSGLVQAPQ